MSSCVRECSAEDWVFCVAGVSRAFLAKIVNEDLIVNVIVRCRKRNFYEVFVPVRAENCC